MKTFTNMCAQGDVTFRRIDKLPETGLVKADHKVVAHSETQHNHSFPTDANVELYTTNDPLTCYLRVASDSLLEHHRSFDTHESIMFPPGNYEIRRQREHTPDGWKRVED